MIFDCIERNLDPSDMLIVPYPLCVPPNIIVYGEYVDHGDISDQEVDEQRKAVPYHHELEDFNTPVHTVNMCEEKYADKNEDERLDVYVNTADQQAQKEKSVYYNKTTGKYTVNIHIGTFSTQEKAVAARDAFRREVTVTKQVHEIVSHTQKRQKLFGSDVPAPILTDTDTETGVAVQITPTVSNSISNSNFNLNSKFTHVCTTSRKLRCYNCKIWKDLYANSDGKYVFDCCGFTV
jgi:hypothetical protein